MILPLHPNPHPDELLSSWMIRLAVNNGWHSHTFFSKVLNYDKPIWNRDVDKYLKPCLTDCLSKATGIDGNQIRALSLQEYSGSLFCCNATNAYLPWVLPLGIYHRAHLNAGLQICPRCLEEDEQPYYRKYWRVAFYTICHKHRCLLLDRCPYCGSCIEFHRLAIGSKFEHCPTRTMTLCHHCHRDLKYAPSAQAIQLYGKVLKPYIKFIEGFSNDRCGKYWNEDIAIPISFFNGAKYLVKSMLNNHSKKLLEYFANCNSMPDILTLSKKRAIENHGIKTRLELMSLFFWLIDQWPKNFELAVRLKLISRSSFSDELLSAPFWVRKQIDRLLPSYKFIPSKTELIHILEYLERFNGCITVSSIENTLNVSHDTANYYLHQLAIHYDLKIRRQRFGYRYHLVPYAK
jgi:hypothetical protein